MKNTKQKKIYSVAYYGILLSLAVIFGWIENMFLIVPHIPGIKLGLSNAVFLVILYNNGVRPAITVNLMRIIIINLLFGGIYSFFFAVSGFILSCAVSVPLYRCKLAGIVCISMYGAVFHNTGQLLFVCIITSAVSVFYYLPFLLVSGIAFGAVTGVISKTVISRLRFSQPKNDIN